MELSLAKPPLLLKDYLLDDLSSCSSSGFRSYPRRQCCTTTIRFLLEVDLKNKPPKYIKKPPHKSPSSSSAFRWASTAVINAFKLTLLPRTLSRKLLKRSFWMKRSTKAIQRWEPIHQLAAVKSRPSPATDSSGSPSSGADSRSSTSDSNCKRNSSRWSSDSDFTASDASSGNTNNNSAVEVSNEASKNDVVLAGSDGKNAGKFKFLPRSSRKRVAVIVGGGDDDDPTAATSRGCSSATTANSTSSLKTTRVNSRLMRNKQQCLSREEEKEQFSPVSVLACPFDDDDEVSSSSPFQHSFPSTEGTKKGLMRKIKMFERLPQLEPLNLEKRIVLSESDSNESLDHHQQHASESGNEGFVVDSEEEASPESGASFKLLQLVKATMPSFSGREGSKAADYDRLLMDFLNEGKEMLNVSGSSYPISSTVDDHELLDVAKDWISGQPREMFLGWEVQKNREAYIRDMERGGKWTKMNDEEKQEVALELEAEVFYSLANELCLELLLPSEHQPFDL